MTARRQTRLQRALYHIIFGTESRAGQWFDIVLIVAIMLSVAIIILDSIPEQHQRFGDLYHTMEWGFTFLFTAEYLLRLWIARNRKAYVFSVYGVIDLLAITPSYLALLLPQTAPLLVIRLLRVLRVFRVLRLLEFLNEANQVAGALRNSARQIFVFFWMVITTMVIFGCLMYVLEGPSNGFDNIPVSIYWAIVTITTVGYGDVVPVTAAGRAVSAAGMLIGYAIIAVPTGIFTSKLVAGARQKLTINCTQCARAGHDIDAIYCKYCGAGLHDKDD